MGHRVVIPLLLMAAPPASGAELSVEDLRAGSDRASGMVTACETRPRACADEATRSALARAFYTLVLNTLVHGGSPDRQHVGNVRHLDPTLYARLPALARPGAADAEPWVVSLTREVRSPLPAPRAPPQAVAAVLAEPEPEPLPDDLPTALSFLERGDLVEASRRLLALGVAGDRDALLHLATAVERLELYATALLLKTDWLRAADDDPRAGPVSRDAVRLAAIVGSRQPLTLLADQLHPSAWDRSIRSDGWLALGESWAARGDFSPALKALSDVDAESAAYARGEYLTGLLYWRTGQPWEALVAFGNAWSAEAEDIDDSRLREMALWSSAHLYEELQRDTEAMARYEVLAISPSPLSERAAYRCARIAERTGDTKLAIRWLAPTVPRGVFRADHQILRARIALSQGKHAAGVAHLDDAAIELRDLVAELGNLVADDGDLWTRLHRPERNAVVAARLEVDPQIAAYRAHLATLRADRRALAAHPDAAWREEVGTVLDKRLLRAEQEVRSEATQAAHSALVEIQRELSSLRREVDQLRKTHE